MKNKKEEKSHILTRNTIMLRALFVCLCVLCTSCSNTCKIPSSPLTTATPFWQQNKDWQYYISQVAQMQSNVKLRYEKVQQIILQIAQENTENIAKIREKNLTNIKLNTAEQRQVTTVWKDVIHLRKKFLYSAVIIADLRSEWQKYTKNCTVKQQSLSQKLANLPSVYSLEKKIKVCDILYDACLQLSLQNIEIMNPYIDK